MRRASVLARHVTNGANMAALIAVGECCPAQLSDSDGGGDLAPFFVGGARSRLARDGSFGRAPPAEEITRGFGETGIDGDRPAARPANQPLH